MAIAIRSRKFVKYNGERSEELLELAVSSASELPEADAIPGILISESSIAWDISTGDFYGLTGETWYKQDGSGAYNPDASLSVSDSRSVSLPETKSISVPEEKESVIGDSEGRF